jgi:hypothetical protein
MEAEIDCTLQSNSR